MDKLSHSIVFVLAAGVLSAAGCMHHGSPDSSAMNAGAGQSAGGEQYRRSVGGGPGPGSSMETESTWNGTADTTHFNMPSRTASPAGSRPPSQQPNGTRTHGMGAGATNSGYSTGSGSPGSSTPR